MENFIVSARKYRPATFATVVGQEAITNTLKNAVRNQQVAQAFLFTGPRGVGKTTCARILAKTINCQNITPEGEACNVCPSCLTFNTSSSFNIFELDAASNNSVDDIRNLVDQVRIIPQQGYKVYIIDEVHMLSQQAFNAFLKTLEEPPSYAKFILATTEKHKILPTILSRCQIFDFRRISVDDIAKHLQFVADSEKIQAEAEALHIIAQKADGALRDALSMFDQLVSYAGNHLTYKQVIENLNVLDYDYYFRITDHILNRDVSNALLIFNEIMDNGFEGQHFITGLGEHFRNLLVSKDSVTLKLLETSQSIKEQYAKQAVQCTVPFIFRSLEILNECDINYKTSNNKKLHVEIVLMQLCNILSSPNNPGNQQPAASSGPATQVPSANPAQSKPLSTTASDNPVTSQPVTNVPSANPAQGKPAAGNPGLQVEKEETVSSDIRKPAEEQLKENPPESASTVNQKTEVKESPAPAVKKSTSLTGLDLGGLMKGKKPTTEKTPEEEEDELPGELYGSEHVSISDLLRVWPVMIDSITAELPMLQHTLLLGAPELLEDNIVNIKIDNTLQAEEVFKYKRKITAYLRKALKNGTLSITTTLIEVTPETRRPYTDTEKFLFLAEKAPAVRKLKDQLGLDLEM
ncbi:MAG TPA: DNA polymerase III subunit gamma/tau [Lentimicrobium sp.]|nr:DNA polymerase III subunit gamma/tau [Lentimicrobium sp.]